jgi:hypothetical protein
MHDVLLLPMPKAALHRRSQGVVQAILLFFPASFSRNLK